MTRAQARVLAERIVGPVGKINPPIELLPAIAEALLAVERSVVEGCCRAAEGVALDHIREARRLQRKCVDGFGGGVLAAVDKIRAAYPEEQ